MDDRAAIVETVTNYWEGWFAGDPDRMRLALHPRLVKTGAGISGPDNLLTPAMSADQMVGWTRDGIGVAAKPDDPAYEIVVNDVYHPIASVTVHSGVYREYLLLGLTPEGWRIVKAFYTNVHAA